jgi:isopenicillin N synthase-like dioxygenase
MYSVAEPLDKIDLEELPIIDVQGLLSDDQAGRLAVARDLRKACMTTGFFYVSNHGVDAGLVERTFVESKRFFAQPQELKDRVHISKTDIFRGYDGPGTEALERAAGADNKESMYMGVDLAPDHPLVRAGTPHLGPNQWPDGLPGWRQSIEQYFSAIERLARRLIAGLALSLELPWTYFDEAFANGMFAVRLLHYPPHPTANPLNEVGAGAHTDFGALTVLAQDDIGGLQVRLPSGEWIDAKPVPGTFVVNIGDLMARWTNDVYTSTLHRVLNRSVAEHRYSIAFFTNASFHTPIACLPTCRSDDRPPRYAPTTAGEHLVEMKSRSYGRKV